MRIFLTRTQNDAVVCAAFELDGGKFVVEPDDRLGPFTGRELRKKFDAGEREVEVPDDLFGRKP